MAALNDKEKVRERIYLDSFLKALRWPCAPEDVEDVPHGQGPDFVVRVGTRSVGIEVTQSFADQDASNSKMREHESHGLRWLRDFAKDYYNAGGLPVQVQVRASGKPTGAVRAQLVEQLMAAAKPLSPWARTEVEVRGPKEDLLAQVWAVRLPDSQAGYSRGWRLLDDAIGFVRRLTPEYIEDIAKKKSEKLEKVYRQRVPDIVLLIVADGFLASGLVQYEGSQVDAHGFEAVYLLHYPKGHVERVAQVRGRGVAG